MSDGSGSACERRGLQLPLCMHLVSQRHCVCLVAQRRSKPAPAMAGCGVRVHPCVGYSPADPPVLFPVPLPCAVTRQAIPMAYTR